MNKDIEKALIYANEKTKDYKKYLSAFPEYYNFWKGEETVTWDELVLFHNKFKKSGSKPTKFALAMLIYLLENKLYHDKYSAKLYSELPNLLKCFEADKWVNAKIFTNNYDEVVYINIKKTGQTVRYLPVESNPVFKKLYIDYASAAEKGTHNATVDLIYDLMGATKQLKLNGVEEIDSEIFWNQIEFVQERAEAKKLGKDKKMEAIAFICKFYRWLILRYPEIDFFKNSLNLNNELLLNNTLSKKINMGYYITTLNTKEDFSDKKKVCFIIKNLDTKSTRAYKNSHISINTTSIKSNEYRGMFYRYIINSTSASMFTSSGQRNYICNGLAFLEKLKKHKDYPNPNLKSLNTNEAILLRKYVKERNSKVGLHTLNDQIGAVRRFFAWCDSNGYLNFDATFFDYFSQFEEPNKYYGNAISDEDIKKVSSKFIELCKEDITLRLYYAIFLILIETEFRVSQVANLTVSSIQPTLKNDQYLVYSNTKTTNGKKTTQPICKATKHLIDVVMEDTQHLRDRVIQESIKDHIFLVKQKNYISSINSEKFLKKLKEICILAGVKPFNTRNLRDTHMTKAFEYIMRNGKSDLEMGLLSKHTHIDTTKSHYIETELTKMLESTYRVTLGSRDINQRSHILDSLPESLKGDENIVENGCGRCEAKTCYMEGSLPCLVCKYFITTVEHKPYFIKMIKNCDALLETATIRHEIEDINLIKNLYANWLREICIKEESKCLE